MKTISISKRVAAVVITVLGILSASAQVTRTIGTLPPGGTVTITFDVTVNTPFPANISSVTNQGSVSAGGLATILTDDPAVGGAADPTITAVFVPPQIACPADITTNSAGACLSSITFTSTVTAGVPAPVVSYQIGATPITSPYAFPLGTNTVTSTATNVVGTNTCSFTVKVLAGAAPQLSILHSKTNVVVSWPNSYSCYTLQYASGVTSNAWNSYPGPFATNGGFIYVTNSAPLTNRFFRLSF
jgi:hypothetical protein